MMNRSRALDILGLDESATEDHIKEMYHKLALIHHPDKGGNAEIFKRLGQAKSFLMASVTSSTASRPSASSAGPSGSTTRPSTSSAGPTGSASRPSASSAGSSASSSAPTGSSPFTSNFFKRKCSHKGCTTILNIMDVDYCKEHRYMRRTSDIKCTKLTKTGAKCKNNALIGEVFCIKHKS